MAPRISIIIPSWNDAISLSSILDCLQNLAGIEGAEIIVAASGDHCAVERAAAGRARVLWPPHSTRAAHMNSGAAVAQGEILFFLHADSIPPWNALELIHVTFSDTRVVGGALRTSLCRPRMESSHDHLDQPSAVPPYPQITTAIKEYLYVALYFVK